MKPKSLTQHCKNIQTGVPIQNDELIQNIDDAKNWLDKAKDEFIGSNAVRGELNLSLAQAEVQRAWELSREQCVSTLQELSPAVNMSRKSSFLLPFAAGFGILMLMAGSFVWFHWQHPGMTTLPSKSIARVAPSSEAELNSVKPDLVQKRGFENTVVKATPLIGVKPAPRVGVIAPRIHPITRRQETPGQKPIVTERPVAVNSVETLKQEAPVGQGTPSVSETVIAEAPPVVKNPPAVHETSTAVATESPRRTTTSPQVEPAAAVNSGRGSMSLSLPEDDLANIAKRSLRSGR